MYYHLQGKSMYYNDNNHQFQDMTVRTPTEKYMYTALNQNKDNITFYLKLKSKILFFNI